jgi:hypothetical protein
MNDDEVITAVREQRDKVHSPTPVEQIISRGRTVRVRCRIPGAISGLAVVTAAAVVLGLGLSGSFASAPRNGTESGALTAVNGCGRLEQAAGTLKQLTGTSLVITTASGQPVTVTTSASTMVNVSRAPLSDITDGAPVLVAGHRSDNVIAAAHVSMGLAPRTHGHLVPQAPPGDVAVQGTVSDAGSAGFAVLTSTGTRVLVTTSSATKVEIFRASLSQLQTGASTIAVGHAGPDRALSAVAVLQPPPGFHGKVQVRSCSAASVDDAMTTALVSGG